MAGHFSHIDEVRDLTVGPMRGGVDDQLDVAPGISRDQRSHDRDRAVARILHAENELNLARIILMEIRLEILGKPRLGAEKGLQDRDVRPRCGRRCGRPPRKPQRRPRRAQRAERAKEAGCDEKQRQAPYRERANVFETRRHISMLVSLGRESDVEVTLCRRFCDECRETGRHRSQRPPAPMARKVSGGARFRLLFADVGTLSRSRRFTFCLRPSCADRVRRSRLESV